MLLGSGPLVESVEHLCEAAHGLLAHEVTGRFGEIRPDKQAAYGATTLIYAILWTSAFRFLDDWCFFCIRGRV